MGKYKLAKDFSKGHNIFEGSTKFIASVPNLEDAERLVALLNAAEHVPSSKIDFVVDRGLIAIECAFDDRKSPHPEWVTKARGSRIEDWAEKR